MAYADAEDDSAIDHVYTIFSLTCFPDGPGDGTVRSFSDGYRIVLPTGVDDL